MELDQLLGCHGNRTKKMMVFWVLLYSLNVLLLTSEVFGTSLIGNNFLVFECFQFCGNY